MDVLPVTNEQPAAASGDSRKINADTFMLEQPIPGYLLTEKVSEGPVSAVFRASDSRLDREVMLHLLKPDLEHREEAIEEFFTVAGNVARVRHENIVRGLDVGRSGDYFYFVTEKYRDESVWERVSRRERGRLYERETVAIARDVAAALQCAFENGLVHHHVCMENILLGERARILGLGLALNVCYADDEAAAKAHAAVASPEQARCDLDIDIRSDLYCLGVTWFRMLMGRDLFKGETPSEILSKHINEPVEPPREQDPRISAATSQLIMWLLEKDRDERPRTPQEFLNKIADHPLLARKEDEDEFSSE